MKSVHILLACTAIILLAGCAPRQTTNVFNDPLFCNNPHFYYDEEHYTLIRVNPETRDEEIDECLGKISKSISGLSDEDSLPDYQPPWPITLVKPNYPNECKDKGIEGTAFLQLLLDTLGNVKIATALVFFSDERLNQIKNSDRTLKEFLKNSATQKREFNYFEKLLVQSALESAIGTKFRPARLHNGIAIEIWISYPVRYVLN
jgi:hypothetical protein